MSILFFARRPARIRTLLCWTFGLMVLLFLTGFGPPQLVDRIYVPTQRIKAGELPQRQALARSPTVSAAAFLLYDVDTNQLLLSKDIHAALPPASLTKLMTALLVIEYADLNASVTIQSSDLVGGTNMGLRAGEVLTVEQLLWGALLPSGNDAATALARHVRGSVDAFVALMNERAQELGLTDTHFVNPHGLDAPDHTSSAADLLTLTRQLWHSALIRQMVATPTTEVAGRTLRNTNELIEIENSANGVKTGTTDLAGQCLVAGLQQDGHQIFIIVLNSRDRYVDTQAIYAYYQANYRWFDGRRNELTALNRIYTDNGKIWYLRPAGPPAAWLVRQTDLPRLQSFRRLHFPSPDQPWQPGMPVGVLEWWLDHQIIGTQPLVLW